MYTFGIFTRNQTTTHTYQNLFDKLETKGEVSFFFDTVDWNKLMFICWVFKKCGRRGISGLERISE